MESEAVILKKELHHLKEGYATLLLDLEEKNEWIGRLERDYNKMKSENELITKTKLNQTGELLKSNVNKAIEVEKEKMKAFELEYEKAIKKLMFLENDKKNLELQNQELQVQNKLMKNQLNDFGAKTNTTEFIKDIRMNQDALFKKDQEYQKLVMEWNTLCDRMEDVLSENRLLRELAGVPHNFGINIEEIKLGDRVKIEDYVAKIKLLQKEVDDLETERAHLKHKLLFATNALEITQPPFNMLTKEQKLTVAEFAQSLYEGTIHIPPERYELLKENQGLKVKIEYLEKQLNTIQLERGISYININKENKTVNQLKESSRSVAPVGNDN
jgi:hypothetical protein